MFDMRRRHPRIRLAMREAMMVHLILMIKRPHCHTSRTTTGTGMVIAGVKRSIRPFPGVFDSPKQALDETRRRFCSSPQYGLGFQERARPFR